MDYDTAQKWIMNHESDSDEKLSLVINMPVVANRKENRQLPGKAKSYRERHLCDDMHGYSESIPQGYQAEAEKRQTGL